MPTSAEIFDKPDALELFTDRENEQSLLRRILKPTEGMREDSHDILTVFYGVGGIGKTTLLEKAIKMAATEFKGRITSVHCSFDAHDWTVGVAVGQLVGELCRCMDSAGVPTDLTFALLLLWAQVSRQSIGKRNTENHSGLAIDIVDKVAELSGVPGLALANKLFMTWRQHSQEKEVRRRLDSLGLWPRAVNGRTDVQDLDTKLGLALYHDIYDWLKGDPRRELCMFLDGFERIQSEEHRNDAQKAIEKLVGYFATSQDQSVVSRFRALVFSREMLRWDVIYHDKSWIQYWSQHLLGGLSERDARGFLEKAAHWRDSHGRSLTARRIEEMTEAILCAASERDADPRFYYPYYLNLAVEIVDTAQGEAIDLGRSPLELQARFYKYLDPREKRAMRVLALAEEFEASLYDWLCENRIIDYTVHAFDSEFRRNRSFIQPVPGITGTWKFYGLMEKALLDTWQVSDDALGEAATIIKHLLEHCAKRFAQVESDDRYGFRNKGMAILADIGAARGLLSVLDLDAIASSPPWAKGNWRSMPQLEAIHRRISAECGEQSREYLRSTCRLAEALDRCNDDQSKQGEIMLRKALLTAEQRGYHEERLSILSELGDLMIFQERHDEAEALLREAYNARQELMGNDHLETLTALYRLADFLFMIRIDMGGAKQQGQEVLNMYRKAFSGLKQNPKAGPELLKEIEDNYALANALIKGTWHV